VVYSDTLLPAALLLAPWAWPAVQPFSYRDGGGIAMSRDVAGTVIGCE
jgi:hypothetical protein